MIIPESLHKSSIKQIVVLEEDLADIHFIGWKKTKCFYKVAEFSRDKTYAIFLQKAEEINIKLFVTPVPRGLQVSHKLGKTPGRLVHGLCLDTCESDIGPCPKKLLNNGFLQV
jgi:hypothetical protein